MQRRKHIKAFPNNINALVKIAGTAEAANSLGVTPAALNKYIRFKEAPKATELAAGSLLDPGAKKMRTIVVQCPDEALMVVKRLMEAYGGNVTEIKI